MRAKTEPLTQETYIGDGVYVGVTSFGDVLLYTSDGNISLNKIYLAPETVDNLQLFLKRAVTT